MGGLVAHAVMDVQNGAAVPPRRGGAPAVRPAHGPRTPEPAAGPGHHAPVQPHRSTMARVPAH